MGEVFGRVCPCFRSRRDGAPVGFGLHDIGYIGGLCLLTNNILGSGMVQIPALMQTSGWLVPSLCFVLIAAWTCSSALFLARTIARLPGNAGFEQRVEFANVLERLFPRWAYLVCVVFVCSSFITQNISNVIVSSQVADDIILKVAGRTCALVIYPVRNDSQFQCVLADATPSAIADSPFGDEYTLSLGWILVAAVTVPLSSLALDDNMIFQVGTCRTVPRGISRRSGYHAAWNGHLPSGIPCCWGYAVGVRSWG